MKNCTPAEQRQLRGLAGLSQYQLAHASGVHATRLSLFESELIELTDEQKRAVRKVLLQAMRARAVTIGQILKDRKINEPALVEVAGRGG